MNKFAIKDYLLETLSAVIAIFTLIFISATEFKSDVLETISYCLILISIYTVLVKLNITNKLLISDIYNLNDSILKTELIKHSYLIKKGVKDFNTYGEAKIYSPNLALKIFWSLIDEIADGDKFICTANLVERSYIVEPEYSITFLKATSKLVVSNNKTSFIRVLVTNKEIRNQNNFSEYVGQLKANRIRVVIVDVDDYIKYFNHDFAINLSKRNLLIGGSYALSSTSDYYSEFIIGEKTHEIFKKYEHMVEYIEESEKYLDVETSVNLKNKSKF